MARREGPAPRGLIRVAHIPADGCCSSLLAWSDWADTSLGVPLSPRMTTGASLSATGLTLPRSARMSGLRATTRQHARVPSTSARSPYT